MGDQPIPLLLWCPVCHAPHIDAPDPERGWANPPHRSHLCGACGTIWRPADVSTVGVAAIRSRGAADTWPDGAPEPPRPAPLTAPPAPTPERNGEAWRRWQRKLREHPELPTASEIHRPDCPACDGEGRVDCQACDGTGEVAEAPAARPLRGPGGVP